MRFLRRIAAMLRPAVEEYDDPVFGSLHRVGSEDWCGEVTLDHPRTGATSLSLLIGATEGRPTDEHRILFLEILSRYAELWHRVAEALANHHPVYNTVEAVAEHIDEPCLCLDMIDGEQPRRWALQYTFDFPNEGDMGYFVDFREWEIVDVSTAD